MAKKETYKDKKDGELISLLSEKREELRSLRFTAAGSRPKDTNAPAKIRKDIARILTEQKNREKVA